MIEFRNETDDPYNVVVCDSITGRTYVHLVGDKEAFHGDDSTTIDPNDYECVEVNTEKL